MQRKIHAKSGGSGYAPSARIALVVSRFNEDVTTRLLEGALECLKKHGVKQEDQKVIWCPGAFELPQVASALLGNGQWDGVVCLGSVIRGETAHFEYVSSSAAYGIQSTALRFGVPIGFGVLTTETLDQAMERSGGKHGNKGFDATQAVLEMVEIRRDLTHTATVVRRRRKR